MSSEEIVSITDTYATKTISLTLPIELFISLDFIRSSTGIAYSGIIQHFLESSDLNDVVDILRERLADGCRLPRVPRSQRTTRSSKESADSLLLALRPLKKSKRLTELDAALAESLPDDSLKDTYVGGNYV